MIYRTGIGRSGRRFLTNDSSKPCMIGGILFEDVPGLDHESDGDVVFHAICNAITSLTGVPILGGIVRELLRKDGYTDSAVYVEHALKTFKDQKVTHIAISLEGKRPHFQDQIDAMRRNIASILKITPSQVGITATSGDGLSDYGCGDGVHCLCIITTTQM
jgi:2-C-methyl-D-erythritol 2,4-cyclodiphosphate synthase